MLVDNFVDVAVELAAIKEEEVSAGVAAQEASVGLVMVVRSRPGDHMLVECTISGVIFEVAVVVGNSTYVEGGTDFIGEDTTCVVVGVERYGDWVVEDGSGVALEVVVGKADSDDDEADGVGVTVVKTVDSGLDGAVKAQVVW